jgi:phospholipid-binding lipoprotein MlaA
MDGRRKVALSWRHKGGRWDSSGDILRYSGLTAIVALCAGLGACATFHPDAPSDPLEPVNREVFAINHALDNRVALPVATFYKSVTPEELREHLHYFLTNLHLPVTVANDVLQGNVSRGGEALERFAVNTTLGGAGIFDVATGWELPYHEEDFGQTMGWYGIGEGPYVILPLAGPADVRDIAGSFVDRYMSPMGYVQWRHKNYEWGWPIRVLSLVDSRSGSIDELREIERNSIDLYATTRSLYRQSREAEVRNGEPDVQGLPDF